VGSRDDKIIMLSYKLARQLKDLGFPQKGKGEKMAEVWGDEEGITKEVDIYIPTLEEVIDELGDDFENLVRVTDIQNKKKVVWWQAYMTEKAFSKIGISCVRDCCGYECGDIPLDAVVRLYIILKQPHENI